MRQVQPASLDPDAHTCSKGVGMNTQPVSVKEILQRKLHPSRFPRLSGAMAAIVGFILDASYAEPQIAAVIVTTDQFVVARVEGEAESRFLGTYRDLLRNYFDLQDAAGLADSERMVMDELFASKIGFYGPASA
jgi:hypothetical protein